LVAAFQKELKQEAPLQALQNQAENVRANALKAFREKRIAIKSPIQLKDFELLETDEKNIFAPAFTLVWLFDEQRKIQLNVSLQDGSAQLRQIYKDSAKLPENMPQPIQFYDHCFETENVKFWRCQLTPKWVTEIAKAFHLPAPYQEWEHTVPILQMLLKLVPGLNQSEYTYTNDEIRKLYKLLSPSAWIRFLQQAVIPQGIVGHGYRSESSVGRSLTESEPELVNPLVMQTTIENNQLYLTFIWEGCPESIENGKVMVEVDGKPQCKVSFEWKSAHSCLTLFNVKVSEKASVGALWEKETGTLRLSFKTRF